MNKSKLAKTCIIVKLLILGSQILVDKLFEDYDQSTDLLFEENKVSVIGSILKVTARWDSHFFISIAQKGYEYEKNHAFFETYPSFLNAINNGLQIILKTDQITGILIAGFFLNLLLNSINTLLLFDITKLKFPKHNEKFYYAVCLIYQFSPSSVFYNAIYSESLFTFFIFTYLYLFYRGYYKVPAEKRGVELFATFKSYAFSFLPSFILSTSVYVRSNGLFLVVIVGYPILEAFILNILSIPKGKFSFKVMLNTLLWGILNIVMVSQPYFLVLLKATQVYCTSDYFEGVQASWCSSFLPNVYSFIQDKHWNVGFLTYYKLSRMFFIIWGFYTFLLITPYIVKYLKSLFRKQSTLSIFSYGELHSQMLYTITLYLISVFYAHSQSSTRFFSSDPFLYWILADILFNNTSKNEEKQNSHSSNKMSKILAISYIVHFNIAGIFLFSNYLSWT